jgi:hypothetical protein
VIDVVIVDDYGFVNMGTLDGAELAIQEVFYAVLRIWIRHEKRIFFHVS